MFLKKITIVARGDTEGALDAAIEEAERLIREGYVSGADSNDEGGYYFAATDDVAPGDIPA